jgi:hypothetical protein
VNYKKVLNKIEKGEMTSQDALNQLYPVKVSKPGKRATFVKMNISVPEEGKGVNTFLKILFLIPVPIIFARIGLRFAGRFIKDEDFNISDVSNLLKYSKNTHIHVDSKDAQINIRII